MNDWQRTDNKKGKETGRCVSANYVSSGLGSDASFILVRCRVDEHLTISINFPSTGLTGWWKNRRPERAYLEEMDGMLK